VATKKQRRRRSKERRHEYEYVFVDDEGNEVEVDEAEARGREEARQNGKRPERSARRPPPRIEPPSWRRVGKRSLIVAPLMFLTVMFLGGNELTLAGQITQTLLLLFMFVAFTYFFETMMYRRYVRKTGGEPGR
jgi:hypothetical protein